jgi:hypothetical protein
LGSQNVDFLTALAENANQPSKINKLSSTEGFFVPQVSMNCLACSKGVKYEQRVPQRGVRVPQNFELMSFN